MENLNDLRLFLVVAEQQSFTKAAVKLGVSPSAVSHAIKGLEQRLNVKLLQRSTRSVSLTHAGEKLATALQPLLNDIQQTLNGLGEYQHSLRGRLRINGTEGSFSHLWEKIERFMRQYPKVEMELIADMRFTDIVAERFDIGIRLGDDVAKDMIAVRVAPDMQMVVVGAPAYFAAHEAPQTSYDLTEHEMIGLRLPTHGGLLTWEFLSPHGDGRVVKVQPHGMLVSNSRTVIDAALYSGCGLIWTPLDSVQTALAAGALIEVLADWRMSYELCGLSSLLLEPPATECVV